MENIVGLIDLYDIRRHFLQEFFYEGRIPSLLCTCHEGLYYIEYYRMREYLAYIKGSRWYHGKHDIVHYLRYICCYKELLLDVLYMYKFDKSVLREVLYWCCRAIDRYDVVIDMYNCGYIDVADVRSNGNYAFVLATVWGRIKYVQLFVSWGFDKHDLLEHGKRILYWIALHDRRDIFLYLIDVMKITFDDIFRDNLGIIKIADIHGAKGVSNILENLLITRNIKVVNGIVMQGDN